jgi:hypothetical protein
MKDTFEKLPLFTKLFITLIVVTLPIMLITYQIDSLLCLYVGTFLIFSILIGLIPYFAQDIGKELPFIIVGGMVVVFSWILLVINIILNYLKTN